MISNNGFNRTRNAPKGVTGFFKKHKTLVFTVIAFAVTMLLWFTVWQLAAIGVGVSFILPSPIDAFKNFFILLTKKEFYSAVAGSVIRVLTGYLLGILIGALAAMLSFFIPPLRSFFAPLIKVAKATPVASFILICALWMTSFTTPVFIALLMVFPIVYENTLTGLKETDSSLIEAAEVYRFSPIKKLALLYAPSAMPYFGSACVTTLGLAWKSCISAEVLIVTAGSVGYYVYTSKLYFETEMLFAWTVAIVLLSVLLEYAIKLLAYLVIRATGRRFAYAKKHNGENV